MTRMTPYLVQKGQIDHVLCLFECVIHQVLQRQSLSRVVLETDSLFTPGLCALASIGQDGSLIGVGWNRDRRLVAILLDKTRGDPSEFLVHHVDIARGGGGRFRILGILAHGFQSKEKRGKGDNK